MPEYVQLTVTGESLPVLLLDPKQVVHDGEKCASGQLVTERGLVVDPSYRVPRSKIRRQMRAVMNDRGVLVPV